MIDITGTSVAGFSAVQILLWIVVVLWGAKILRKIWIASNVNRNDGEIIDWWTIWKNSRTGILFWFLFLLAVLFYQNQETAYRPKTIITNPAQHQIDREMEKVDETESPQIQLAPPMSPIGESAKMLENNDRANKKAREEFNGIK